jgi:hypothetical protein
MKIKNRELIKVITEELQRSISEKRRKKRVPRYKRSKNRKRTKIKQNKTARTAAQKFFDKHIKPIVIGFKLMPGWMTLKLYAVIAVGETFLECYKMLRKKAYDLGYKDNEEEYIIGGAILQALTDNTDDRNAMIVALLDWFLHGGAIDSIPGVEEVKFFLNLERQMYLKLDKDPKYRDLTTDPNFNKAAPGTPASLMFEDLGNIGVISEEFRETLLWTISTEIRSVKDLSTQKILIALIAHLFPTEFKKGGLIN